MHRYHGDGAQQTSTLCRFLQSWEDVSPPVTSSLVPTLGDWAPLSSYSPQRSQSFVFHHSRWSSGLSHPSHTLSVCFRSHI